MSNQELSTKFVESISIASNKVLLVRDDINRISDLKIYDGIGNKGTYTKIVELADKYDMHDMMKVVKVQVLERLKIIEQERADDLKGKLAAQ